MTERQAQIFMVINEWWKKYGFAPSIENIMFITGDKSKGNVHRIIKRLVEDGHCKKEPRKARSVRPKGIRVRNL